MLWANSKGQDLSEHLAAVGKLSRSLMSGHTGADVSADLTNKAYLAGILHDLGKADFGFQEYITAIIDGSNRHSHDDSDSFLAKDDVRLGAEEIRSISGGDSAFIGPFHHEISWAILTLLTCELGDKERRFWSDIEWAVYHHHVTPGRVEIPGESTDSRFYSSSANILCNTSVDSIIACLSLFIGLFDSFDAKVPGLEMLLERARKIRFGPKEDVKADYCETEQLLDIKTPDFFRGSKLVEQRSSARRLILRGVLVTADRQVSELDKETCNAVNSDDGAFSRLFGQLAENSFPKTGDYSCSIQSYEGSGSRENEQVALARAARDASMGKEYNAVVAALPAGFGKTRFGLLWSRLVGSEQLLWICPRNSIAEAIFLQIQDEHRALFPEVPISVELFLTGRRQESNKVSECLPEFSSDIIVTNIDSVISPFFRHDIGPRVLKIFSRPIVFDEYHEFVGESPMFALFLTLMRVRRELTLAQSLFLSATPIPLAHLWSDGGEEKIIRADPVNAKRHEISLVTASEPSEVNGEESSLTFFNSIKNAQRHYLHRRTDAVAHSLFSSQHKRLLVTEVLSRLGKSGARDSVISLSSSPICRAALDISRPIVNVSIGSPWDLLQAIGRFDRWGDSHLQTRLVLIDMRKNRAEMSAIRVMMPMELHGRWIDVLSEFLNLKSESGKSMFEFKELYNVYHDFMDANGEAIRNWLTNIGRSSFEASARLVHKSGSSNIEQSNDPENLLLSSSEGLRGGPSVYVSAARYRLNKKDWRCNAARHQNNSILAPLSSALMSLDRSGRIAGGLVDIVSSGDAIVSQAIVEAVGAGISGFDFPLSRDRKKLARSYTASKFRILNGARNPKKPLFFSLPPTTRGVKYNRSVMDRIGVLYVYCTCEADPENLFGLGPGLISLEELQSACSTDC